MFTKKKYYHHNVHNRHKTHNIYKLHKIVYQLIWTWNAILSRKDSRPTAQSPYNVVLFSYTQYKQSIQTLIILSQRHFRFNVLTRMYIYIMILCMYMYCTKILGIHIGLFPPRVQCNCAHVIQQCSVIRWGDIYILSPFFVLIQWADNACFFPSAPVWNQFRFTGPSLYLERHTNDQLVELD